MKLIVGLGNPGEKYKNTRHNVGFLVLDQIANSKNQNDKLKFKIEDKFKAEIAEKEIDGEKVIFALPQTYMNKSGEAVQKIANFYKIKSEDVIVVCDDLNLNLGQIRIRKGGSDGGHNGLKSVIVNIGENFWRVRVGIGSNKQFSVNSNQFSANGNQFLEKSITDNRKLITENWLSAEDYVLQKFSKDEQENMEKIIDKTADLLVQSISSGMEEETINIEN